MAYAVNEWLASQGYIVMSVNYRSGIGYGKSFRTAPNTGGRGNAEYRDVIAAGKYLQTRADVDPTRVGIWGLSYGGVLTSQALARNSDVFAAGVDMAGVHLWGNSLDTADVSYKSSTISAIDGWKSPVLIWHNDDDRNVEFSQTIGLVDLLRARNVYYELIVNPDDTHETLIHSRWLYVFGRMDTFFTRFLRNEACRANDAIFALSEPRRSPTSLGAGAALTPRPHPAVEIRPLRTIEECEACVALQRHVWGFELHRHRSGRRCCTSSTTSADSPPARSTRAASCWDSSSASTAFATASSCTGRTCSAFESRRATSVSAGCSRNTSATRSPRSASGACSGRSIR